MAITYNKQIVTKDRLVMPRGPRDRQLQQQQIAQSDNSALIAELRSQISNLQDRLSSSKVNGWTDDQVNTEIIKAVKEETVAINEKHQIEKQEYERRIAELDQELNQFKVKVKFLEKDVEVLNEKLEEKAKFIDELKKYNISTNNSNPLSEELLKKIDALSMQINTADTVDKESGRPQMGNVFIDPIEKEPNVESHFEVIEDISISDKEALEAKKNKLKSLLGKLPSKR